MSLPSHQHMTLDFLFQTTEMYVGEPCFFNLVLRLLQTRLISTSFERASTSKSPPYRHALVWRFGCMSGNQRSAIGYNLKRTLQNYVCIQNAHFFMLSYIQPAQANPTSRRWLSSKSIWSVSVSAPSYKVHVCVHTAAAEYMHVDMYPSAVSCFSRDSKNILRGFSFLLGDLQLLAAAEGGSATSDPVQIPSSVLVLPNREKKCWDATSLSPALWPANRAFFCTLRIPC